MKLLYFFLPGCSACAETTPIVEAFAKQHPEVLVAKIDIIEWQDTIAPPESVPSFALLRRGQEPRTLTGDTVYDRLGRVIKLEDLERWALGS